MLRSIFILSILIPGFVAALQSRHAALLMYLWFALFRPQEWLWVDTTSLHLSLILGVLLLVPSLATGIFPNLTHPLSVGMVLFLFASLAAQVGAVSPDIGWQWIDFAVRLFLVCMLLVTLVGSAKRLVMVLAVVSASLGFHAAKAGLAWLLSGGGMRFAEGLSGAFTDNNGYALGTVMIMPLLLGSAQNVSQMCSGTLCLWIKRGLYAAVLLCAFTVVGTYSRGGFLALSSAGLMHVVLQRRRFTAVLALCSLVTVLLLVVPIQQSYVDRLQTLRNYDETDEDSGAGRVHFWRVAAHMGTARPFGVGLRQYEAAYDAYDFSHGRFGRHRAVHSSHFQVLAELGLTGTVIWVAMFVYAFVVCVRIRRRSRNEHLSPEARQFLFTTVNALMTSMTGFLVGGTFLTAALNDITWLTFAIIAALDRISAEMCAQPASARAVRPIEPPLAFRVVESFATMKGRRA